MSVVQGPRSTPISQVSTTQATSSTSAPVAPRATADVASGFGTSSTFAADPAVAGPINRALGSITRAVPNLPASVLQPLQDAAASQVNALANANPRPTAAALQTALNKVLADFNGQVNGAISQQNLAAERGRILQHAQGVLDQKITKIDASVADPLRQAAKDQLTALANANPPLSNTALQAATDKVARGFIGQVNDASERQYAVGYLLGMVRTPDPRMDAAAFTQFRDAAMSKVADLLKAQPPLPMAQFRQEVTAVQNQVRAQLSDGIQAKRR